MKTCIFASIMHFLFFQSEAQELFLLTNPTSNVSKSTMVIRGMNSFFQRAIDQSMSYHFMPEIEYGISKKLMIIANSFISNENHKINVEGVSVLSQYRFYSNDNSKKHFRMAMWSRIALNNAKIHQEEIELNGHNTGFKLGLTATKLLHKTALSCTISYQKALNNFNNSIPQNYANNAMDYTLSYGQLVWPRSYKNFKQTNINLMFEILGQKHGIFSKSFLDMAPVVQFIFKSKARLDVAYRRQLYSHIYRTQPNGMLVNFQYNIFNL